MIVILIKFAKCNVYKLTVYSYILLLCFLYSFYNDKKDEKNKRLKLRLDDTYVTICIISQHKDVLVKYIILL